MLFLHGAACGQLAVQSGQHEGGKGSKRECEKEGCEREQGEGVKQFRLRPRSASAERQRRCGRRGNHEPSATVVRRLREPRPAGIVTFSILQDSVFRQYMQLFGVNSLCFPGVIQNVNPPDASECTLCRLPGFCPYRMHLLVIQRPNALGRYLDVWTDNPSTMEFPGCDATSVNGYLASFKCVSVSPRGFLLGDITALQLLYVMVLLSEIYMVQREKNAPTKQSLQKICVQLIFSSGF